MDRLADVFERMGMDPAIIADEVNAFGRVWLALLSEDEDYEPQTAKEDLPKAS